MQTLKQNTEPASSSGIDVQKSTEPRKKESVSTQTQTSSVSRLTRFNHQENSNLSSSLVKFLMFDILCERLINIIINNVILLLQN